MGAGKIIGAEAARVEQGDRQCIAQRQRRGRAGGRRQIMRASLLGDAGIQMNIRLSREG